MSSPFPADRALPVPPTLASKSSQAGVPTALKFVLNKKRITLPAGSFDPDLTLLEYLRTEQGLTGTKLGCAEGGCGACTVVSGKVCKQTGAATGYEYKAVNACLLPMVAVHGGHVLTVEGIGTSDDPHPVQERIAKLFGSQCGFCTPGIVMSLYATIRTAHSLGKPLTELEIEQSLDGNLCRCTGYRPILDAAKTFATAGRSAGKSAADRKEEAEQKKLMEDAAGLSNGCPKGADCCKVKKTNGHADTQASFACSESDQPNSNAGLGGAAEAKPLPTAGAGSLDTGVKPVETTGFKPYRFDQEIIFPPHLLKAGFAFDEEDLVFPSPAVPAKWLVGSESEEDTSEVQKKAEPERRTLWIRPGSLASLIETMRFYAKFAEAQGLPPSVAKLRSGNTETGIEVKFKHQLWSINVYVSDHLSDLAGIALEQDGNMRIGANFTLQSLIRLLREKKAQESSDAGSKKTYAAQLRQAVLSNLSHFAGTQIRNVASLAGNISTASPISDLNPVWVASNARVSWIDPLAPAKEEGGVVHDGISMREFFKGYRKTALPPSAILTDLEVSLDGPSGKPLDESKQERRFIRAYKQAKRKDDDIAIVNGALYATLSAKGEILDVCFAYGGMAPTTAIAKATCEFLQGKQWGDEATLRQAMMIMAEKDFDLPYTVPGGMPAYRKALALGFFARFWAELTEELALNAEGAAALALKELPSSEPTRGVVTKGSQDLEGVDINAPSTKSVGKSLPHLSALKQVTGEAAYVDDIPPVANEAYAALIMSQKAHAKIVSIDKSPALAIPGVVSIVTVEDIPEGGSNYWNPPAMDEVLFADGEVHTVGQVIGVVVAEDKRTAQRAARAVKIEYQELPHILTIDEAIAAESYFKPRPVLRRGDAEKEDWSDCDQVLEGETRLGGQEHFYFETNACLVVPGKEDQEVEIFSSTQNPTETQAFCAAILNVPNNRVVVRTKRLGGGFGGKETRPVAFAAVLALAAKKAKRPVRCMLDRDEDMWYSGQRHPFKAVWKIGYSKDGKLQRLQATVYNNGGWSQDLSQAVLERAMTHIDNCCFIPHVKVSGFICRTNTMSNTAFRGFGGPQGMFISQDMLTKVAAALGIRTEELIDRNMYKEGEKTHFGQELIDWNVPALWSELKASSDFEKRKAAIDEFNKQNRWKKRGISLVPTKFGISFTALMLNQAYALIHIYSHDGSVLLSHGGTEMGQGLHTKMAQVAATELGIPIEKVHIVETNTQHVGNTSATAASASSDLNGMAIQDACRQINERLDPFRKIVDGKPTVSFEQAAHDAYFARVQLSAVGHYKTPDIGYDWKTGTGKPFFYFTQGAAVSEVEVDTLTGDHVILRSDIYMDIGRSINPSIDVGQIEGAFTQGFGLTTIEESLWLPSGRPFNNGPGNLKIPAFLDTPQDFRISFLKGKSRKINNLRTIQSSKGVGEPPLFLGCTVFFAIRNALASARQDVGKADDGKSWQFYSPATPEKIRTACADEILAIAAKGTEKRNESDKPFFLPIY